MLDPMSDSSRNGRYRPKDARRSNGGTTSGRTGVLVDGLPSRFEHWIGFDHRTNRRSHEDFMPFDSLRPRSTARRRFDTPGPEKAAD